MKGFKNFKYKYEKQEDGVKAIKYYDDIILFAYKDSDLNDVYTGITKINKCILKLIPDKYIEIAGGYNNLDIACIKCAVQTVDEKVILSISLRNCKTFELTITKKYLQENNDLGLLNINPVTATKHYDDIILFTCRNSDFNDIYTGIRKLHRSILKLIPSKYIDLAGGYDDLDVVGIKCIVCKSDEKVILSISLRNCKTFELTVTKKYLQENDNLGLLNVNPVTASIVYNDVKLFDFVLEDNHIDRNKTYNVYHNVTYHNGLSKFLNRTKDDVNNISIENEYNSISVSSKK